MTFSSDLFFSHRWISQKTMRKNSRHHDDEWWILQVCSHRSSTYSKGTLTVNLWINVLFYSNMHEFILTNSSDWTVVLSDRAILENYIRTQCVTTTFLPKRPQLRCNYSNGHDISTLSRSFLLQGQLLISSRTLDKTKVVD